MQATMARSPARIALRAAEAIADPASPRTAVQPDSSKNPNGLSIFRKSRPDGDRADAGRLSDQTPRVAVTVPVPSRAPSDERCTSARFVRRFMAIVKADR